MDVSIIIVNYNTKLLLENCLKSIQVFTVGLNYEIIVVDNNSSDGSCKMVQDEFPDVVLIASTENLGFGRANNLGIASANGKYCLLLNSDTKLFNNAVYTMWCFFESNVKYKIGAVGGILVDEIGNKMSSFGKFLTIKTIVYEIIDACFVKLKITEGYKRKKYNEVKKNGYGIVDYVIGADLMIPKYVIDNIGVFDSNFFMYLEEMDLQKRMFEEGYISMLINNSSIIHLEGGSFVGKSKISYKRFAMSQISLNVYIKKHFKGLYLVLIKFFILFIYRMPIYLKSQFSYQEKIKAIKLIFTGEE